MGHVGGIAGHVGGFNAGQMARVEHEHPGLGRHRYVGDDYYDYGLDCPYYPNYGAAVWPYTCNY
jgi:hypothetical protein